MRGSTVVYQLLGCAIVQYVKLQRYHTQLRFKILHWLNDMEEPCTSGRLRNGSISLKSDGYKDYVLTMHDKKTLQKLIAYTRDGTQLSSALLYVMGRKARAIGHGTMTTCVNEEGSFEMKLSEKIIPLDNEAFKSLLQ